MDRIWTKRTGRVISKERAKEEIARYVEKHPGERQSLFFDIESIKGLTDIPGVSGVSATFAYDDEQKLTVVLVPRDSEGKAIYQTPKPVARLAAVADANVVDGGVVNVGAPCPPYCPTQD